MSVIRIKVPPDQTPEEEAALVAEVAASFEESTGSRDVDVQVERSEELDFHALQGRFSSRWAG